MQEVVDFVIKTGGIKYATTVMHRYKDEALDILKSFPESDSKNSLIGLVEYTISREK